MSEPEISERQLQAFKRFLERLPHGKDVDLFILKAVKSKVHFLDRYHLFLNAPHTIKDSSKRKIYPSCEAIKKKECGKVECSISDKVNSKTQDTKSTDSYNYCGREACIGPSTRNRVLFFDNRDKVMTNIFTQKFF